MLPPKVDATLTVAHAKAIEQHRNAHHKVAQDHRLAQERCEALEEECKALREADRRRETALQDALKLLSMATRGKQEAQREAKRGALEAALREQDALAADLLLADFQQAVQADPALPAGLVHLRRKLEVYYAHRVRQQGTTCSWRPRRPERVVPRLASR